MALPVTRTPLTLAAKARAAGFKSKQQLGIWFIGCELSRANEELLISGQGLADSLATHCRAIRADEDCCKQINQDAEFEVKCKKCAVAAEANPLCHPHTGQGTLRSTSHCNDWVHWLLESGCTHDMHPADCCVYSVGLKQAQSYAVLAHWARPAAQ
jgi:hypothetical protein